MMPLSLEERARKLASIEIVINDYSPEGKTELVERIKTQLREACEEAVNDYARRAEDNWRKTFTEAFAQGVEEGKRTTDVEDVAIEETMRNEYLTGFEACRDRAAAMVQNCSGPSARELADRIRELKP